MAKEKREPYWARKGGNRIFVRNPGGSYEAALIARGYRPEEEVSKEDLLARAKELNISGRTTMSKEELEKAIAEAEGGSNSK